MEGIEGAVPTILLVMLLFAQIHLLEKGGCIDMMIQSMDRFIVGPAPPRAPSSPSVSCSTWPPA